MRVTRVLLGVCIFGLASLANAQATRTWVSGVGDDVNPCSRTAPCKTWAGAISKTAAGGEIDALDPGGYGAVSVTKSIVIDGAGTNASILSSGTNGVIINDSATGTPNTIEVILRNLSINGAGTGIDGIRFVSGKKLVVENCVLQNFTDNAIDVLVTGANSIVVLRHVSIDKTTNDAIKIAPTNSLFLSAWGVKQDRSTASSGLSVNGNVKGTVAESSFSNNPSGGGIVLLGTAQISLSHVTATGNNVGVWNFSGTPNTRLNFCTLTGNTLNGALNAAGTMTAFQSNVIENPSGVTSTAPQ